MSARRPRTDALLVAALAVGLAEETYPLGATKAWTVGSKRYKKIRDATDKKKIENKLKGTSPPGDGSPEGPGRSRTSQETSGGSIKTRPSATAARTSSRARAPASTPFSFLFRARRPSHRSAPSSATPSACTRGSTAPNTARGPGTAPRPRSAKYTIIRARYIRGKVISTHIGEGAPSCTRAPTTVSASRRRRRPPRGTSFRT